MLSNPFKTAENALPNEAHTPSSYNAWRGFVVHELHRIGDKFDKKLSQQQSSWLHDAIQYHLRIDPQGIEPDMARYTLIEHRTRAIHENYLSELMDISNQPYFDYFVQLRPRSVTTTWSVNVFVIYDLCDDIVYRGMGTNQMVYPWTPSSDSYGMNVQYDEGYFKVGHLGQHANWQLGTGLSFYCKNWRNPETEAANINPEIASHGYAGAWVDGYMHDYVYHGTMMKNFTDWDWSMADNIQINFSSFMPTVYDILVYGVNRA